MIPVHVETMYQHEPWANWLLIVATILASVMIQYGVFTPDEAAQWFTLGSGGPLSLFGHMLAHANYGDLAINMFFLWILGNAVCGAIGNLPFLALYLALGCISGLVQLAISASPVAGGSGAVAGLIGVGVAFFPVNNVSLYYPHGFSLRYRAAPLWILAIYWVALEGLGAGLQLGTSAPWGQIGGAAAGLTLGLAILAASFVQPTESDNGSLLDFFRNRGLPVAVGASARAQTGLRQNARSKYEERAIQPAASAVAAYTGRRLTLARSGEPPLLASTPPLASTRPGASVFSPPPLTAGAAAAASGSVSQPLAWPADLPEGLYFYFDGASRHGPIPRDEFLTRISLAADTMHWLYRTEGSQGWLLVGQLGSPAERLIAANKTGTAIHSPSANTVQESAVRQSAGA
jgi:membrane associated rhomboid family serine protease